MGILSQPGSSQATKDDRCYQLAESLIMEAARTMMVAPGVELPEIEIAEICRRHAVQELALFGSAARGEMGPNSDYDFLVDFLPDAHPVCWDWRP